MNQKRKRSRISTISTEKSTYLDEKLIDDTLQSIQLNNEIIDPTRRKVKHLLQSKLDVSKKTIKNNRFIIDSAIDKYWMKKSNVKSVKKTNINENDILTILMLPDVIQQKIFLNFHPKLIYTNIPIVCKYWKYLTMKKDFLTHISKSYLRISHSIPISYQNLIPQIQNCCKECGYGRILNKEDVDDIFEISEKKFVNNKIDYIIVPFDSGFCKKCFKTKEKFQSILCDTAKNYYKLNKDDLAPIEQQINPFLLSLKHYARVSDIKQIAIDKYGDLSIIPKLSPLDVAVIDKIRKNLIKSKIEKLKRDLLKDSMQNQIERKNNVKTMFNDNDLNDKSDKSDSDDYEASFVRVNSNSKSSNNDNYNDNYNDNDNGIYNKNSINSINSINSNKSDSNFENVKWPTEKMMNDAKNSYQKKNLFSNDESYIEQKRNEIENIELDSNTLKSELNTFLTSNQYNNHGGFSFFIGSHGPLPQRKNESMCKDKINENKENCLRLKIDYNNILDEFENHLHRVRERKWKIWHRSDKNWYQDWFHSTWNTNDYRFT